MHRLVLDVNDSVMDKVIYFLNHLPKKDVKIIKDEKIDTQKPTNQTIDFSQYSIETFKHIQDPVAWQKEIRSEWDR